MEIIELYFTILLQQFQWDIEVMSQGWMYYWMLIPIVCYLPFFFMKWMVLFTPLIIPVSLVAYWTREVIKAIRGN